MDESPRGADSIDLPQRCVAVRAREIGILTAIGLVVALREGAVLVAPVLVAVLLAYALEPFVAALERRRVPRATAVFAVYGLLIAGLIASGRIASEQASRFIDTLPATVQDLRNTVDRMRPAPTAAPGPIDHLQRAAADLQATLAGPAPPAPGGVARIEPVAPPFDLRGYLAGASMTIGVSAVRILTVSLLTLLLLLTGETLKRKLIAIAGPRAQRRLTHDVIKAIDRQIERYLVARLLISATVAVATWLGLWALGVRGAFALGLIAGVLNVMPIIGPAVAVGLIGVAAFLQFHTVEMAAAATGVAGLIAMLEGNLLSPWLTARAGELNTVAVFVSVLFWGWMWDASGLLLAIPIMVAVKAAADHIEPLQPLGELLGR